MDEVFQIRPAGNEIALKERDRVLRLLRALLPQADISEVGSTAVEGAIGKQDTDLAVLVAADEFETARATLDTALSRDPNQFSSDCYQGYQASSEWDVAVQLTVRGGEFDSFGAFVAALQSSPELLLAYNELKQAWHGKPMADYRQAKVEFIERVLTRR